MKGAPTEPAPLFKPPIPRIYRGVRFRSTAERNFALAVDMFSQEEGKDICLNWLYEPVTLRNNYRSWQQYTPDFVVSACTTQSARNFKLSGMATLEYKPKPINGSALLELCFKMSHSAEMSRLLQGNNMDVRTGIVMGNYWDVMKNGGEYGTYWLTLQGNQIKVSKHSGWPWGIHRYAESAVDAYLTQKVFKTKLRETV